MICRRSTIFERRKLERHNWKSIRTKNMTSAIFDRGKIVGVKRDFELFEM